MLFPPPAKLPLVIGRNERGNLPEQLKPGRSDTSDYDAAVVATALPFDPVARFHPVKQAGNVWITGN